MKLPRKKKADEASWERSRIGFACFRIEQLLQALVAYKIVAQHALFFSVITELLIHLRDLCSLASKPPVNIKLTWTDDITPCKSYSDITELIAFFRDGFCHSNAYHAALPGNKYSLQRAIIPRKPYSDDTAIFLGENRIFLFRHIGRAFEELRASFVSAGIIGSPNWSKLLPPHDPLAPRNTKE